MASAPTIKEAKASPGPYWTRGIFPSFVIRTDFQQQGVWVQPQLLLQPQLQPQLHPPQPPQLHPPQLQQQPPEFPPQLLFPQQHQMMISRMMIQQQLPPPKPLLHIRGTSYELLAGRTGLNP